MPKQPLRRATGTQVPADVALEQPEAVESTRVRRQRSVRTAGKTADFSAYRTRILPQIIPNSLLEFCYAHGRELVALPFAGELAIAFVLDEDERYSYITIQTQRTWAVSGVDMFSAALTNLRRLSEGLVWKQINSGPRSYFLCETFDGYDASRMLLPRELAHIAGRVVGNLIVGIPHRDYMVAFGDSDLAFVTEMSESVQNDFLHGTYPITPQLFTLEDGQVVPYRGKTNEERLVN